MLGPRTCSAETVTLMPRLFSETLSGSGRKLFLHMLPVRRRLRKCPLSGAGPFWSAGGGLPGARPASCSRPPTLGWRIGAEHWAALTLGQNRNASRRPPGVLPITATAPGRRDAGSGNRSVASPCGGQAPGEPSWPSAGSRAPARERGRHGRALPGADDLNAGYPARCCRCQFAFLSASGRPPGFFGVAGRSLYSSRRGRRASEGALPRHPAL